MCYWLSRIKKEDFHNSTNRKDRYSVYHTMTTWICYVSMNKATILLKLKAGDVNNEQYTPNITCYICCNWIQFKAKNYVYNLHSYTNISIS